MNIKLLGQWFGMACVMSTGTLFAMESEDISHTCKKATLQNRISMAEKMQHAIFEFEQSQESQVQIKFVQVMRELLKEDKEANQVLMTKMSEDNTFQKAYVDYVLLLEADFF